MHPHMYKTLEQPEVEKLLTIPQTCTALGVSRAVVYAFIARGELKAVKLGERCTRIRASDIHRLVAARTVSAPGNGVAEE
jgi:excisionase family DNA binding protein